MCGIAGVASLDSVLDGTAVSVMLRTMRHRGPDDFGQIAAGQAAIGATRLAIVDIAGGRQPIANETGTIHAVFNG